MSNLIVSNPAPLNLVKWVKLLKLAAVMSKTVILDELNFSHYGSLRNCREHFHEKNFSRLPKEKLYPRANYHATLVLSVLKLLDALPEVDLSTLQCGLHTCTSFMTPISLLLINHNWRCAGSNHRLCITGSGDLNH